MRQTYADPELIERCHDIDLPTVPLVFRYGLHRVRDAVRVLPQAAWSVESQPDLCGGRDYELLIDVERLNIDAASFRQMEEAARSVGDIEAGVRRQILDTVQNAARCTIR